MAKKPYIPGYSRKDKQPGISEKVINILKIINLIESRKYPDVKTLALECEVSERSIYRYLNIINTLVTVVFDREKGGYRFEPPDARKVIPLEPNELALIAALKDLTSQIGSPVKETFQNIMSKFISIRQDFPSSHLMLSPLSVSIKRDVFEQISRAIKDSRRISIKYHAINTDEVTRRKVDPLGLFFYDGIWFLYAYCHLRKGYRWFALDRIIALRILKERFKRPEALKIEDFLQDAFRFWQEDRGNVEVTVIFLKPIADIIKRKSSWHPTEQREILPTGDVQLTFNLSSTREIKWWIYSWLPYVKVVRPETLKDEIRKELRTALKMI